MFALAAFLEDANAPAERLVIIGGSALLALGLVFRTTKDVDILANYDPESGLVDARPMSRTLQAAALKVATELRLDPHWLNLGPASQMDTGLPEGFEQRLVKREYGPSLTIYLPDRLDLIHLKLFAIIDQGPGRHVNDFLALSPTEDEVLQAARWVLGQDASEVFPSLVKNALSELGYGQLSDRL
jgi:hypothetical protein